MKSSKKCNIRVEIAETLSDMQISHKIEFLRRFLKSHEAFSRLYVCCVFGGSWPSSKTLRFEATDQSRRYQRYLSLLFDLLPLLAVCTTVLILFGQSRSVSAARGHRVIMAARMGTQNQASANDNSGSSPGNLPSQARPRLMTGQLHRDASSSNNKAEFDPSRSVAAWSSAANGFNNNRYSLASAVSRLQNTNYAPVGNAAVRSAVNRPIVQVAEPEDPLLVRPIFNRVSRITENDLGGDPTKSASDGLLLSGYGNNIGGYMLGRIMLNRLRVDGPCCERCNCSSRVGESIEGDSYLAAYIPFRYRFRGKNDSTQTADIATTSTTAMPLKSDDSPPSLLCALQRWNRELPFTELPNMLLSFISDDEHSGKEYSEKAR